ncbi:MAG: contractile injection system tape measure protein, partial [Dehalococcoidia bacterium]
ATSGSAVADAARPAAPSSPGSRSYFDLRGDEAEAAPDTTDEIYITNAGQVLASPYFSRLFEMLGLTEGPAFRDPQAAERGAHLLQFMVNESTDSPEYELTLNKLLCGIPVGRPIERSIDITDREKEVIEGLIQGMIHNWRTIGNTSVAGFRETFLQREGRLQLRNDAWHLLVEQRPFDILLDSLPWSFSTIRHPWMERVIYVEWR